MSERRSPVKYGAVQAAASILASEAQRRLDSRGTISTREWEEAISATSRKLDGELSAADEDALGEAWVRISTGAEPTKPAPGDDPEDAAYRSFALASGITDPASLRRQP